MTNRQIYNGALRLLGEVPDTASNEDYLDRAPYLLAAFCTENAGIDRAYREAHGMSEGEWQDEVYVELDAEFPLCSRLSVAARTYLAAMLILDENETLSDTLFDRYCGQMARLCEQLPASVHPIIQRY